MKLFLQECGGLYKCVWCGGEYLAFFDTRETVAADAMRGCVKQDMKLYSNTMPSSKKNSRF